MGRFIRVTSEILADAARSFLYFVTHNLRTAAGLMNLVLPYAMYFIGRGTCVGRSHDVIGYEILIPVVVIAISYFIRSYANKIGKGYTIPVPERRFTEVDGGEVSVENRRIQELLLYLADLEDWMERQGLM